MNKRQQIFFTLICCLVAACHAQKTPSAAPSVSPDLPSIAVHETTNQTQSISPIAQATLPAEAKPAQEPLKPAQTPSTLKENIITPSNINSQQKTTASLPVTTISLPVEDKTLPNALQDSAVFTDEELIDTKGRLLHPYLQKSFSSQSIQQAPWAYEQLKYGIYYSFIKAGTAYIRNRGLVDINGRVAYLLQTSAFSATVIDAIFKVRDINHSWLDAQDFYSLGYGQSVREGTYKRDEWLSFDYPQQKFYGKMQKKAAPRDISGPLNIPVLDILSSLYYVRAQKLEIGKELVFDIINREKQYPLIVKILKKEKIKTTAGTFNTIVVEPQIRGEGIFVAKGKNLKVWLTDDQYKMPVKMKVEVFIGSVSAELLDYKRQEATNIL